MKASTVGAGEASGLSLSPVFRPASQLVISALYVCSRASPLLEPPGIVRFNRCEKVIVACEHAVFKVSPRLWMACLYCQCREIFVVRKFFARTVRRFTESTAIWQFAFTAAVIVSCSGIVEFNIRCITYFSYLRNIGVE